MAKLILTIVTIFITISIFAQNIWVRIPNYELDKEIVNQSLSNLDVTEIKKAFPASRNSILQEVYQINCNCNVNDLISIALKNSNFINPEIGPNYQTLDTPNDYSIYGYDWALNSINATQAWDLTHGDSSIVIAITDANYYIYHEDLAMKSNYISPNNSNTNYGHGTAVAINAAGNTNNGTGKSSIGRDSRLQLRKMDYNEILEATYSGAKVINASWASSCFFNSYAQMVIDEAYQNGSTIVASAGNGSTCGGASNLVFPASYNHVISVSSIGVSDNHERIVGNPTTTHQHNFAVDLVAPGYDVLLSTGLGQYINGTGTSFAAPMVSGTIALMLSVNKCLTPDQIESIIKLSADSNIYEANQNYLGQLGSGKLDAEKAVQMAKKLNTFQANLKSYVDCSVSKNKAFVENTNGQYPLSYYWSNGSTSEFIEIDSSSLYTVEVTDQRGCKFFSELNFTDYTEVTMNSNITDVLCNGMNNGSIELYINGGVGNYDILWSNGLHSQVVNNLSSGFYQVSIKDEAGCQKFEEFFVNQPETLVSSISYTQPSDDSFGSILLVIDGGTLPYNFQWNSGQTTQYVDSLEVGFYEVLITDAKGCMISENIMLNLFQEQILNLNDNSNDLTEIFPNPSSGLVNFKLNTEDLYDLVDNSGKIVKKFENSKFETFSFDTAGIYYLKSQNSVKKIIIH